MLFQRKREPRISSLSNTGGVASLRMDSQNCRGGMLSVAGAKYWEKRVRRGNKKRRLSSTKKMKKMEGSEEVGRMMIVSQGVVGRVCRVALARTRVELRVCSFPTVPQHRCCRRRRGLARELLKPWNSWRALSLSLSLSHPRRIVRQTWSELTEELEEERG